MRFKDILAFFESRLQLSATMRQRLVRVPFDLDYPYWIEDPDFDLEYPRLFELPNGKAPGPMRRGHFRDLSEAPPMPTTSIFTRTDGIVHWRGSVQRCDRPDCENIAVHASHCGLGVNPASVYAIADRLAQPEGEWAPFVPSGMARLFFPQQPPG